MYYQNYEDYMRSILGYPVQDQSIYAMDRFENQVNNTMIYRDTKELEDCYPEIYRMINPIVCEICDRCGTTPTRNDIDNMIEEIYQRITVNNEIAIKINIENRTVENEENRNSSVKTSTSKTMNNETIKQTREVENRQRRPNDNQLLRDLIRILILNRLLGRDFVPGRPPHPRPPFPGRPGDMMPRPPMQRDYGDYLKF